MTHSSPEPTNPTKSKTNPSDVTHHKSFSKKLVSALKKPFQGWSMDLMAARDGLDDDYNFARTRRRGEELRKSERQDEERREH